MILNVGQIPLQLGEVYDIRDLDSALIPIAPTLGDNDFGQNAFASMSETRVENLNFFTFLHGNDLITKDNIFHKMYKLQGYNIEIYSINSGYYGFFQKRNMLDWLIKELKKDEHAFKVAFYHNPLFPGCPDHKPTFEEVDYKLKLLQIFTNLNVRVAFEHHEHLYKISYPMHYNKIARKDQNSTIYIGGGQWGTPNTE